MFCYMLKPSYTHTTTTELGAGTGMEVQSSKLFYVNVNLVRNLSVLQDTFKSDVNRRWVFQFPASTYCFDICTEKWAGLLAESSAFEWIF